MYAWVWRHLPGPPVVRVALAAALATAAVALLLVVVFPRVADVLPYGDVTVGPDAGAGEPDAGAGADAGGDR